MIAAAGRRRPGHSNRSAGFVYLSTALVVLVLVAVMALTVSQNPPPAIAELSPAPVEQIKDAPDEQSSELGSGEGGADGGEAAAATTTTTVAVVTAPDKVLPRVRRCVGNPPRQTEDPQSPPCVTWDGTENGGATTKGVTASEIRVAVPTDNGELNRHFLALQAHFNKRYEFYGRKLRLIPFKHAGHNVPCTAQKADAVKVDKEIDAFASIFYSIQRGTERCYYDELAVRGIMSMQSAPFGPNSGGEASMEKFAPYQWSYLASLDENLRSIGDLICKGLSGRPPEHASGVERTRSVRKFGIVTEIPFSGAPSVNRAALDASMKVCGESLLAVENQTAGGYEQRNPQARQAIARFKSEGVTSIMCLCEAFHMSELWSNATLESYYPEWIVQDFQSQSNDAGMNDLYNEDQKAGVFGIRTWPKALPRDQSPYWWALREGDATMPAGQFNYSSVYWDLLVLASGIQMAGPKLTPQAFQDALYQTEFPNPGCSGPPSYQSCVDFGPNNHTMTQDVALVWYDAKARPRDTDPDIGGRAQGGYCYVNGGQRYRPGQLPAGRVPFFEGPCL